MTLKLYHDPNNKRLKSLSDNFVSLDQERRQFMSGGALI